MEFCDAFIALQGNRSDLEEVALSVYNAQLTTDNLNYELTRLLLDSCGFQTQIPKDLVTRADVANILQWIEQNNPGIPAGETPLKNVNYFRKCASFFEQVFYLDWNKFTNEGNFDTYFSALLDTLAMWNYDPLYEISFILQLKLITAYLRRVNESLESYQNYKPNVSKYAAKVHENTVFFKKANCQIFGNTELHEWIKLDDSFATDENLRSIVWCTKLDKPSVVCHALSIVYSLLRMNRLREKLMRFVRKLTTIFEDLCFTENRLIFDWICRCCEYIYKYHRERISPEFMADLLDNLYAEDRRRAKSIAGFWISSVFNPNCHRTNIRIILKFLEGKEYIHWKVLVDSLIDDYSVIVDWKLLVRMLLDEDNVPEDTKLTTEEKGGLVMLMVFAIEETCTGYAPEYRMDNMKRMDVATCKKFSENVTEVLVPCFWKLFRIEYPHKERIQMTLLKTIQFYCWAKVDKEILKLFVKTCASLFGKCHLPHSLQVIMEVLQTIMTEVLDEEIVELCNSSYLNIRNDYEFKLAELVNDYFNYPNKYSDLDSDCAKEADGILIRVMCINRMVNFSQLTAFDLPQQLLARKILPSDPILFSILQVCVHLISEHVHRAANNLKDFYDKEKIWPENYDDIRNEVDFAYKQLIIKLMQWYQWPNLAVTTFLCLCKIFSAMKEWPLTEEVKNALITNDAQVLIARFVEGMVWKADDRISKIVDNGTKTCIVEGFLNMIEWKLLPLEFVYDPISNLTKTKDTYSCMEDPLRRFISGMCQMEEEATVVNWLSKWLTGMFRLFPAECFEMVSDFINLIHPIFKKMQNIMYLVALKGINFALGKSNQEGQCAPKSNLEFLPVLAKFCEYLDQQKKHSIETFSKQGTLQKDGVKALRSFIKCLKKKPALRKSVIPKPVANSSPIMSSRRSSVPTFDESMVRCSSIESPNSVTDESDLESNDTSERSLIMVRNRFERNPMFFNNFRSGMASDDDSNDAPPASTTLVGKSRTPTEITGSSETKTASKYGSGDESDDILLGTSVGRHRITSFDKLATQSPPQSALVQDTLNVSQSPSLPSSSVMMRTSAESVDTILSNQSEEFDTPAKNIPQELNTVADLLDKSKSPPISSALAMLRSQEESIDTILLTQSDKLDNQAESTPQVLDNVADLLNIQSPSSNDNIAANKSTSVTESSGDFPAEDIQNNILMFSSPKESDDQAINTSQAYGSVSELLKDLDSEVPDDYFALAKSPSVSGSSGRISDVVKNFQRASLSKANTESTESSSSAFDKSPVKKKRKSHF